MREDIVTDELLARYALGRLSDEELERVEARLFADRQFFERLLVVEDELIDRYAFGQMSEDERKWFEKYLLQSSEDKERVEFARELAALVSREPQSQKADESPTRRNQWLDVRRIKNPWVLVPLAATLLIAAIALWLVFQTMRLNDRIEQIEAQRVAQAKREQELEQQISEERRRSQALAEELERAQSQAGIEGQSEPAGQVGRSFLSFILTPGSVRDRSSTPKLVIPANAKQVRLEARFATVDYPSYRAELQTVEGRVLWQRGGLAARKQGAERRVRLGVPAGVLRQGDYVLILSGITSAGEADSVAEYYFRVVRE